jgi:hypothetical protein
MNVYSGLFSSNTGLVQLSSVRDSIRTITFFGIKSFNTGAPVHNVSGYNVGVTSIALPYTVNSGSPLTLDFGKNDILQNPVNFYVRGAAGEGYYAIAY